MDWNSLFGTSAKDRLPEFADIGCGYGGLLTKLSVVYPEVNMVGMEIRLKVSEFVKARITAMRAQSPGKYDNICCLRTNAMKNLLNFFHKGQLTKMFFLFPDPHFKRKKHKWRIISTNMLAEYAAVLKTGGLIYTITDVEDLHHWMVNHIQKHPLFSRLNEEETAQEPVVPMLFDSTEEGQKVTRNGGKKWAAVFRRLEDPPPSAVATDDP